MFIKHQIKLLQKFKIYIYIRIKYKGERERNIYINLYILAQRENLTSL